jgi:protease I
MRQNKEILAFVRKMSDCGRIVSSVCHGPWVMVSAGIVKGRKITCYQGCRDDLVNAGADYVDQPVVVDDNFITAQHYRDNPVWMKETLKVLEQI